MNTFVSCMMRFNTTLYFHCTCSCPPLCLALDLFLFRFPPSPLSLPLPVIHILPAALLSHTFFSPLLSPNSCSLVSHFFSSSLLILPPPPPSSSSLLLLPLHPTSSSSLLILPLLSYPTLGIRATPRHAATVHTNGKPHWLDAAKQHPSAGLP